jgi:hypothetical protein
MQTKKELANLNQLDKNKWLNEHIASLQNFITTSRTEIAKCAERIAPTEARLERTDNVKDSAELVLTAAQISQIDAKNLTIEISVCRGILENLTKRIYNLREGIESATHSIKNLKFQIRQ